MGTPVKHNKTSNLHVRLEPSDMEGFHQWMINEGFNPNRDASRFIRSLLRAQNKMSFITDADRDALKFHFTNFARVGGLLNQLAYTLNVERLKYQAGETDAVSLNPKELEKLVKDVHREVVETKKAIIKLCEKQVA